MADFPALTIQLGVQRQIQDTNYLQTGAGIKPRPAATNMEIFANGGTIILSDHTTVLASKNITAQAGTGAFDFSLGTGIFKTSTGAVTIGNGAVTVSGLTTFTAAGTALTVTNNALISGSLIIGGNLTVQGTTTTTHSESVTIDDNNLYLNSNYTLAVAQTGGLTINYLPIATATVVTGAYVASVGPANASVTTSATVFAPGQFIQFGSSLLPSTNNTGLYEVLTHIAGVLTIKGLGTTPTVEDFTQNDFVAGASDGAAITRVNVSVMRAGTDGLWEMGLGAVTPVTFADVSTATTATLQSAYQAGNTITTTAGFGVLTFTGTENFVVSGTGDFVVGGSVDAAWTTTGGFTATAMTGAVNLTTTSSLLMVGGAGATFGDDTGVINFGGTGALSSLGLTTVSLTGSGAMTLTGGAASSLTTSVGGLTITSAGAATWSTAVGGLTLTSAGTAIWRTTTGDLTVDAGAILKLGVTAATAVNIGRAAITTTITGTTTHVGALNQSTGAVALTATTASSFTTSIGALTITAAVSSTWRVALGTLTLDGGTGINLQGGGVTSLTVTGTALTIQSGATLTTTGTGMIDLPLLFKINNVAVGVGVIAANLTTLTAGPASNADALHTHSTIAVTNISVTGTTGAATINAGELVAWRDNQAVSGTPRVYQADADGAGTLVNAVGFSIASVPGSTSGSFYVSGELAIPDAAFTGGVPAVTDVGKKVYMSTSPGLISMTPVSGTGETSLKVGIVTVGGAGAVKINIQIGEAVLL